MTPWRDCTRPWSKSLFWSARGWDRCCQEEGNLQGRKPLSVAERLPIGAARNLNQFPLTLDRQRPLCLEDDTPRPFAKTVPPCAKCSSTPDLGDARSSQRQAPAFARSLHFHFQFQVHFPFHFHATQAARLKAAGYEIIWEERPAARRGDCCGFRSVKDQRLALCEG
jgi:hypothetical protein